MTSIKLLMHRTDSSHKLLPQAQHNREDPGNADGATAMFWLNFWSSFIHLCLADLQENQKWRTDAEGLLVDQVILIADPRFQRISGLWVRAATAKVREKTYTHPVTRLFPVPQLTEDHDWAPGSLSADGQLS